MSEATVTAKRSGDPAALAPRWARLIRVAVLLIIGLTVTFSATFHEQFAFDLVVAAIGLLLIGVSHGVEWIAQRRNAQGDSGERRSSGSVIALLLGIVSIAAGVLAFLTHTELALALILAAWALVSALFEFLGKTIFAGSRQDPIIIGAAGLIVAVATLLARNDLVAVIGFFGAYAILTGVFLGIAALDFRRNEDDAHTSLVQETM